MFTFKGVRDTDMGVNALPFTRTLKAEQRVIQTYVAGRDGTYDWTDGTYANGTITIPCIYFGSTAPATIRQVAAWLAGSGQLIFDDEPDKYYEAHVYNTADLERQLYEGAFEITFTVFPFALSQVHTQTGTISTSGGALRVVVDGTANTPCLITIINNGDETINAIRISHAMDDTE